MMVCIHGKQKTESQWCAYIECDGQILSHSIQESEPEAMRWLRHDEQWKVIDEYLKRRRK